MFVVHTIASSKERLLVALIITWRDSSSGPALVRSKVLGRLKSSLPRVRIVIIQPSAKLHLVPVVYRRCYSMIRQRYRSSLSRVEVILTFLSSVFFHRSESFLVAGPHSAHTCHRRSSRRLAHDLGVARQSQAVATDTGSLILQQASRNSHGYRVSRLLHMATADSPTQEQQLPTVGADSAQVEGMKSTTPQTAPRPTVRAGVATDGTALEFRVPSTQEMHQLGMGDWVAQRGLCTALVAVLRYEIMSASEGSAAGGVAEGQARAAGPPKACVVIEPVDGLGGSSVATRVCLLRHTRADGVSESVEHALLDEAITQFLNGGARMNQLRVEVGDESSLDFYTRHGFVRTENDEEVGTSHVVLRGDRDAALAAIRGMAEQGSGGAVVMNLVARLLHDKGDLEGAVDAYLKAVQMDSSRGEVFRGLGGAYQSQGQHQMAFASYQQALDICPTDLLAYLKLGLLYEQLAVGKYEEAGDHAIRCLDYYLSNSGSEDTDVLTRLGNLQVLRLDPAAAVGTYERALAVDPSLGNVWFNLANAHLKLDQQEEAARCLHEHIRLDPNAGISSKYLLASLESDSDRLTQEDQLSYARELFDYYAPSYDDHMRKKLLYTAPRILRQNVREVYNATFQALPEATKAEHDHDVLSYLNQSLDILDLGCGTGLVGSWFKDYGRRIVGVDVSPVMLDMATKKGCYHELRKGDLCAYLAASDSSQFDVVIAAETLQYLGPLDEVFADTLKILKPGGLMAFTVDRLEEGVPGEDGESEEEPAEEDHQHVSDGGDRIEGAGSAGGYVLKTDGTYAYDRPYIVKLARLSGFEIVVLRRHAARVERGEPAPGYLGVFRKPLTSVHPARAEE